MTNLKRGQSSCNRWIVAALGVSICLIFLKSPSHGDDSNPAVQAMPFRVAAVQFNPRLGKLKQNIEGLIDVFDEAARDGAKIIVAPEMATTGYMFSSRQEIAPYVDTIPGATTKRLAKISQEHHCYLAWGMPEVDVKTGLYYNSMAVVGPEGYLGKYRKTHLWETETHWAAYGNAPPPIFRTAYGNLSLLICQDANYSETFRLALLGGADIICFGTNSSGQTVARLQARAIQNGLCIIAANRSDEEKGFRMRGCSSIWSALGEKLAEASLDREEIVSAEIDPSQYSAKRNLIQQRRPEMYANLARHIAPWDYSADNEPRRIQAIALQYTPAAKSDLTLQVVERMLSRVRWRIKSFTRGQTMVVMPELSLVGRFAPTDIELAAESLQGRSVKWMSQVAIREHCWIVFGFPEKGDNGAFYNTVVLLSPAGEVVAKARKTHLNEYDRQWATAGEGIVVVDTGKIGRVGLLVGSDAFVPEVGVLMAIERPSLVAVPSSWHGEVAGDGKISINPAINPHGNRGAMVLWDNLSWEHLFYVVAANFVGGRHEFQGRSGIYSLDPIYDLQSPALANAELREQTIVGAFTTLHNDHWITQEKYIASRRSASRLYYPLIRPGGKWRNRTDIRMPTELPGK